MEHDNIVRVKSYTFAVKIVKMYQHLVRKKQELVLAKQLLRSGTSIGANVEEALGGQSRADFISKISIAYKEARETSYWLRLLRDTNYLNQEEFENMNNDIEELCKIIAAIQKTTKNHFLVSK